MHRNAIAAKVETRMPSGVDTDVTCRDTARIVSSGVMVGVARVGVALASLASTVVSQNERSPAS